MEEIDQTEYLNLIYHNCSEEVKKLFFTEGENKGESLESYRMIFIDKLENKCTYDK